MTNIDQFESVFRSAAKEPFALQDIAVKKVLYICDQDASVDAPYLEAVKQFIATAKLLQDAQWEWLCCTLESDVDALVEKIKTDAPDLICTYRNLGAPAMRYPFSLGVYVDVLTQVTHVPVLLLPRPELHAEQPEMIRGIETVMAITDHLTGEHRLVNYAARLAEPDGTLLISHVEDETVLNRYLETIGRIPAIDTDAAAELLPEKLLDEPRDYIRSCRQVLADAYVDVTIDEIVTFGRHLADYRRLVQGHSVSLLVLNTKDQDQSAMHGLAYPLTVELRTTPMLLL